MTFAVTWPVSVVQELARLEAADVDPARVRTAAAWVDYALRRVPRDMGESRDGDERVWYGDVLGVHDHVDPDAMKVRVIAVGPARRR